MKKKNIRIEYSGILILLLIAGIYFTGSAQEINFIANADRVMRAGEQFQLVYSVDHSIDEFTPPDFKEFRYLGGPMQSSSTSINMVNGKTTRVSNYTFTYYLQAPSNPGTYRIEAATAKYKRTTVQSNFLEIEIVGASQNTTSTQSSVNQQGKANEAAKTGNDLYVRLETDKRTVYQGEQVTAWVKLYTKLNVVNIEDLKFPDYVGFYKQDIDIPQLKSLEREKVGDDIYGTGVFSKVILFPQRSGELVIEPLDMTVVVQDQTQRRSRSMLDDFFGPQYDQKRVVLKSKPVTIKVKPLPANKPADFSGAVGQFTIQASANTLETVTNDAITFKVSITGKGNIKLLKDLSTQFPPTFDVFEPVKNIKLDNTTSGRSGTVSFEYTAIPRHAGNFKIAPFKLNYFDPVAGRYKTISSQDFDIAVAKGDGDSTSVVVGNLSKEDIQLLGSDIRYIHPDSKLRPIGKYIFGRTSFYLFYIFSFLLFALFLLIRREQIRRSADAVKYRNRKAGKIAGRRLKVVRKILSSDNKEAFFEELGKALWSYISDKLSISVSDLSKQQVSIEFEKRGIDSELREQFFAVTDTCEYARFAPGGGDSELRDIYQKASTLINKLDQKL